MTRFLVDFRVLWVISEKMSCRLISRGKKHAYKFLGNKYPAQKIISLMKYNAEKKILHSYMSGKKFLSPERFGKKYFPKLNQENHPLPSHSPTNVQWSCQPFRGWGRKRMWHLSKCHPPTKWLARVYHVVVFKTKVLHFKIENIPIKDTNGKRKFKRMLSFLFVDKRKLFAMKLSFEEFKLVLHGSADVKIYFFLA